MNASVDNQVDFLGAANLDTLYTDMDVHVGSDTLGLHLGAGDDASLIYNGTAAVLTTDLVAASDFLVDCGTAKTLELVEVVWDDIRTPVQAIRLGGSQPPSEVAFKGSYVLSFPSNLDKTLYFIVQLPHSYKQGEDIEFHLHQVIPTSGAGAGAENVKWDFTHSWANMGDVFPAETTVSATIDVQSDVADTHYLEEIAATITGTSKTVSSMILCSLTRDVSVANDYTDSVYVTEVDFHFPINTMGSRQEGVK